MRELQRVCVKLYAPEPAGVGDEVFVPIFHEWIRDRSLEVVFVDVADYTHVPDGPGVMLVTHDVTFALDRGDGRFGLLAQRRRGGGGGTGGGGTAAGDAAEAIAATMRGALVVADRLAGDDRLRGRLSFRGGEMRVEANDRLRAPNSDSAYAAFEPIVRAAVGSVYPGSNASVTRAGNDSRDRLAAEVRISSS